LGSGVLPQSRVTGRERIVLWPFTCRLPMHNVNEEMG
jgi:hypothetical protein